MPERDRDHTSASLASQDDGTLCRVPTTILDPVRADCFGWSDGNITIHEPEEW